MTMQFKFFDGGVDETVPHPLEGFRYRPFLIDETDESALIEHIQELPFQEFDFHGYKGKRRVVSFGWRYDYSGGRLQKADDIPAFLLELREAAASFAGMKPAELHQALVTEYAP